MSVTVDMNGITSIRTGVVSTYVLSLHSHGSSAKFYKIGRTKNLPSRIASLLSTFNDGDPRGYQGFPMDLVGVCPIQAIHGHCELGNDCLDHQYDLVLHAHIEGDIELHLHRRFAHLRLDADWLHSNAGSAEWFWPCSKYDEEDDFSSSIDAWLELKAAA